MRKRIYIPAIAVAAVVVGAAVLSPTLREAVRVQSQPTPVEIGQLPSLSAVAGADLVPVVHGGTTMAAPASAVGAAAFPPAANLPMGGKTLTGLANPTTGDMAATKAYADSLVGTGALTGAGAPAAGLGADGNLYIDTADGDLYRKSAGSWSKVGNLSGNSAYANVINVINPANWPRGVRVHGNPGNLARPSDDADAIQAIIHAHPGRVIYLPRTLTTTNPLSQLPSYYLRHPLTVSFGGQSIRGDGADWGGTVLLYPKGVTGVVLDANNSGIQDIQLVGSEPWTANGDYTQGLIPATRYPGVTVSAGASDADGVRMNKNACWARTVTCQGFGRDGINAGVKDSDHPTGFGPDDSYIDGGFFGHCRGDGIKLQGGDANCFQINAVQLFINQGWGIEHEAFLAGVVVSPQATGNHYDNSVYRAGLTAEYRQYVAALARSGNTVTLTWASPPFQGTTIKPGDAIEITRCDPDPSFVGKFSVLASNGASVAYTQAMPDKTVTGASSIVARAGYAPPDAALASAVRVATPAPLTPTGTVRKGSAVVTVMSSTARIVGGSTKGWSSLSRCAMWAVAASDIDAPPLPYSVHGNTVFPMDIRVLRVDSPTQVTLTKAALADYAGAIDFRHEWYPANTTTVTFTAPYIASGRSEVSKLPFQVGQGITLTNFGDTSFTGAATNQGTFVVLSCAPDNKTVSFAQRGPAATATINADATARMTNPLDTWIAAGLRGGSYRATGPAGLKTWVNPYHEGGHQALFSHSNILIGPTFNSGPPDTQVPSNDPNAFLPAFVYGTDLYSPAAGSWTDLPTEVAGVLPVLGYPGFNRPMSVVWGVDAPAYRWTRAGKTASQDDKHFWQDVALVNSGAADPTVWMGWTTNGKWSLYRTELTPKERLYVDTSGVTRLSSEGSNAVTVNTTAGTGTGGLTVGDGAGKTVFAAAPNGVALPTLTDAQEGNGTIYFGSDHGGALCRKDSTGTVHVGP
jgi:hypothetical protein